MEVHPRAPRDADASTTHWNTVLFERQWI